MRAGWGILFISIFILMTEALALPKDPLPIDPKKAASLPAQKVVPLDQTTRKASSKFALFDELNKKSKAIKMGCYEAEEGDSTPVLSPSAFYPKSPNDLAKSQIGKGGTVYFVDVNIEKPAWSDVVKASDICKDGKILRENYCTEKKSSNGSGSIKATGASVDVDCSLFGATCNAKLRACVFSKKAYVPPYCNDSDGGNIFNQGIVTSQSLYGGPVMTKIDSCGPDGKSVFEYLCNDETETIITPATPTPCPASHHCEVGACIPDNVTEDKSSCVELPETVETAENKGIQYSDADGNVTILPDQCFSETVVWEMKCDGKEPKAVPPTQLPCDSGEVCNDGICVPDIPPQQPKSCIDLDPANDVYKDNSGAAFNLGQGPITAKDSCQDDKTVVELTCQGVDLTPLPVACKDDEACLDGLCIPQGCSSHPVSLTSLYPLPGNLQIIQPPSFFQVMNNPNEFFFGDFNHDKFPDILWGKSMSTPAFFLSNGTDGVFADITAQPLNPMPSGYEERFLLPVSDLNGDGFEDIVYEEYVSQGVWNFSTLLSDDPGLFLAGDKSVLMGQLPGYTSGDDPNIQWTDFNKDGVKDLFLVPGANAYAEPKTIVAHFGKSSLTFAADPVSIDLSLFPIVPLIPDYTPIIPTTGLWERGHVATDLNGDGVLDILLVLSEVNYKIVGDTVTPFPGDHSYVARIVNDPTGQFAGAKAEFTELSSNIDSVDSNGKIDAWETVRFHDFNGDGRMDFAAFQSSYQKDEILHIWLQQANGKPFTPDPQSTVNLTNVLSSANMTVGYLSSRSFQMGDLNGDGLQDFVVLGYFSKGAVLKPGAMVLFNQSSGDPFSKAVIETMDVKTPGETLNPSYKISFPGILHLQDLNKDGCQDLIFSLRTTDVIPFANTGAMTIITSKP